MVRLPDFSGNRTLKLIALILALLLWAAIKGEEPRRVSIGEVPVEIELNDPEWTLIDVPEPASVRVAFSGPVRELVRLSAERPRIVVPVDRVQDSIEVRSVRTGWVRLDGDLQRTRAEDVQPPTVRLVFDRTATRIVPIAVVTEGDVPDGYSLLGPVVAEPAVVRVTGSARTVERLDVIRLVPLDLGRFSEAGSATVAVDTAGLGPTVAVAPLEVSVFVPLVRTDTVPADDRGPLADSLPLTAGSPLHRAGAGGGP